MKQPIPDNELQKKFSDFLGSIKQDRLYDEVCTEGAWEAFKAGWAACEKHSQSEAQNV